MSIVAALPIRGLADGKSRLRHLLPDHWRHAVILALLERVARAVLASGAVDRLVVISPDAVVLAWVERLGLGIITLRQTNTGLNAGLWAATNWARAHDATMFLALNADLPSVTPESIRALVTSASTSPAVVVASDRHRRGTNALLVQPPGAASFRFGEQSFARHMDEGAARGLTTIALHDPALAFDLDTPADLLALLCRSPLAFAALWRDAARLMPTVSMLARGAATTTVPSPSEAHR